ncbi:MAG TPA: hypothetical protein VF339_18945 [Gammaproteobacteria bacterium]
MERVTRRRALAIAASAASVGVLPASAVRAQEGAGGAYDDDDRWAAERARVRELGFTEDEALCWEYIGRAAGKFFELPVLHELDAHEIAEAVHVFQNKLLSRPTYRRYLELAKQQNAARETD